MKKIVIEDVNHLATLEIKKPKIGKRDVLIKVHSISLCGSDIHLFNGTYSGPKNYPIAFGHEWSGEVVEIGQEVSSVAIGDRVTGDCSRYCGTCNNCKIDPNLCETIEKFGITIDGASAEYIVRDEKYVYPFDVSIEYACAALAEPLAVSAHLINRIFLLQKELSKKRILVFGMGGIGLGAVLQLIYKYGCSDVSAIDISKKRSELAKLFGAKIIDPQDQQNFAHDTYTSMYETTGYDIIIDTTGSSKVFPELFQLASPFGIIGCLGMLPHVDIPQKLIVLKALTITGTIGGTGYFKEVLEFIKENHQRVKQLISHSFQIDSLDTIRSAFAVASNTDQSIKVQLEFLK